jgi:hypothetical protein
MNHDHNLITALILKYGRGEELTGEETRILEAWRAESEENRALPDLFRDKEWVGEQLRQMPAVPTEELWTMISQRTGMEREEPTIVSRRSRSPAGMAAIVILLLGIGAGFFFRWGQRSGDRPIPLMARIGEPGHYQSVPNPDDDSGQVLDSTGHAAPFALQLPDGSKVRLAYGSSLRYAAAFSGKVREIFLRGQADFEVAPNSRLPFVVHVGNTTVRVLGTHFNIMGYADEFASEITLLSGKVQVESGGETRLLEPSEQAVVQDDRMVVRRPGHPEGMIGWADQKPYFEFENTDVNTLIRRMARWYGVKVSNPENVTGKRITGIFSQQDSLDTNLAYIRGAVGLSARIERRNDTIFLFPPGPPPAIK